VSRLHKQQSSGQNCAVHRCGGRSSARLAAYFNTQLCESVNATHVLNACQRCQYTLPRLAWQIPLRNTIPATGLRLAGTPPPDWQAAIDPLLGEVCMQLSEVCAMVDASA
jgi:hypothetical protein